MGGLTLNIWSILIIIGAIQGFVLAAGLVGNNKPRANRYLSLFLLVTSLHLCEYAIAISGLSLRWPHTITSTYPLLFMMGPFFYLYTRAIFKADFKFKLVDYCHFIPSLVVLVLFMPFYIKTGDEKIEFVKGLVNDKAITIPVEQFLFMFMHMLQTLVYVTVAYATIDKKEKQLFNESASPLIVQFSWLKKLTIGFIIYLCIYLISLIVLLNVKFYRVEIDYVVLMLTSILIYAIGYSAINQPKFFEHLNLQNGKSTKGLKPEEQDRIKNLLLAFYHKEKPYLKEQLKLEDVAKGIAVQPHQLSMAINDAFGINFFEFTNNYRIEEAKALLKNPAFANHKIIAVAFDAGFGNKATFNRVFKNNTGLTPSAFKSKYGR